MARLQEANDADWEQTWSLKAGAHTIANMPKKSGDPLYCSKSFDPSAGAVECIPAVE